MTKKNDTVTVQAMMEELDALLAWFESDEFVLEEATAKFRQAEELANKIDERLTEIKNNIQVVRRSFDEK